MTDDETSLETDIKKYTDEPVPIVEMNDEQIIGFVGIEKLFGKANYKQCHRCEIKNKCPRVITDKNDKPIAADCPIEKEIVPVVLYELSFLGLDGIDKLLLPVLFSNLFRIKRLYALETFMSMDKDTYSMLNKSETQYAKTVKQIAQKRVSAQVKTATSSDLSQKMSNVKDD